MDHKTAKTILDIRKIFHIPLEGFETYKEALDWYKEHYRIHKKRIFNLRLWYKFDDTGRLLESDFIKKSKGFYLPAIPQLDKDVPLDKTITDLITDSGMEEWKGPAMRVIVLTARNLSSSGIPPIPEWLSGSLWVEVIIE